ncbi:MAG TPA: hypothetical protein V6C76_01485 [Drouetiella sp.]
MTYPSHEAAHKPLHDAHSKQHENAAKAHDGHAKLHAEAHKLLHSETPVHKAHSEHNSLIAKKPLPDTLIFSPLNTDGHHPLPRHIDFHSPSAHIKGYDFAPHSDVKKPAQDKPQFDTTKSVAQNIKEGKFGLAPDNSTSADHKPVEAGKAPKISVVYENKTNDASAAKPNYIVKKDGSISVIHNPEGPPHDANVVIQVARDDKQTAAPDKVQQKAVDELVAYQGARIANQFANELKDVQTAQGKVKQVPIDDAQNLVSDKVEQKFGDKLAPDTSKFAPPAIPADVKQTSDRMNRVHGSGGHTTIPRESAPGRQPGDSTPAGIDQMIPPRAVPQAPKEANSIAAAKDAAAALFGPERSHPYDTIKQNSDHSYRVGRYGLNQGMTLMGLAELMGAPIGDPPDMSQLRAWMQSHPGALQNAIKSYAEKMTQDADKAHLDANDPVEKSAKALETFAQAMANPTKQAQFENFLTNLKGDGQPISRSDLAKFMPKELQEVIAEKGIAHEAKLAGEDPSKLSAQTAGKISLAFLLGRTPTEADLQNSQYVDYTRAGTNMFKLAETRQQSLGDIDVSDAQGKIVAAAGHSVGQAMWQKYLNGGDLGCAASVSAVLNEAGFSYANSVGVSALQDQLVAHGWTVSNTPQPGDVVCGYRKPKGSGKSGQAHTGIVGPDGTWDNHSHSGRWSHDPLSAWNTRAYPSGVVFLHPPGS